PRGRSRFLPSVEMTVGGQPKTAGGLPEQVSSRKARGLPSAGATGPAGRPKPHPARYTPPMPSTPHPTRLLDDRATRLFIALAAFFCVNAVLAEFIGVKIFALEDTLGVAPLEWNLFGQRGSLSFTAGTLLWPVVFIFTDVINEFFGRRGVRMISWIAVALIVYGFFFAFAAIALAPASWWVTAAQAQGVPDYQAAFAAIFGQGMWTIAGSVTAFLIGQLVDVQ